MIRSVLAALLFLFTLGNSAIAQTCSVPNTLTNGTNADATQVMANFAAILTCVNSVTVSATAQRSGRLTLVGGTQINFAPLNGDRIKINGSLFALPAGGIAGCLNTGVFVNGASGQNLAASTLYYVYAFSNSGTATCDFSTTGHATSSTSGNVGIEIKSGDDTRSLIGMVLTNGSGQFVSSATQRWIRSWFNDPGIAGSIASASYVAGSSATATEISSSLRLSALTWTGEQVTMTYVGEGHLGATGATGTGFILPNFNGGTSETIGFQIWDEPAASFDMPVNITRTRIDLIEGANYATAFYRTAGATATFDLSGELRTNGVR